MPRKFHGSFKSDRPIYNYTTEQWMADRLLYVEEGSEALFIVFDSKKYYASDATVKGVKCYLVACPAARSKRPTESRDKRATHHRLFKTSVAVDAEDLKAIETIARKDKIAFAEALRQVITWGLDSIVAQEYGLEKHELG